MTRKKKICKNCGEETYLFSKGRCKRCTLADYANQPKKPKRKTKADEQPNFNKKIRERDSSDGYFTCISCDKHLPVRLMHAGHYLSVSHRPDLRDNEYNVNGQCIDCNIIKHGNVKEYRKGLIKKYGLAIVEQLENKRNEP